MTDTYERLVQEQFNTDAARIGRLEEINAKLVEALDMARRVLAGTLGLPVDECTGGPFAVINAALAAARNTEGE